MNFVSESQKISTDASMSTPQDEVDSSAAPTPIVRVSHLTHRYGNRVALWDLSLNVNAGEIFAFLGPNGSGKTTLFRILSTLMTAPKDCVRILNLDAAEDRDAIRRQIGVVFQSPSLDKQLTAEENLRCHGHLYGLRGRELNSRIDRMLSRLGLAERRHEYVETFSGGMRRRVELAKGLLNLPKVLLLDEPSTGLDPTARIDLWRTLQEIQREDRVTILLTTHLMDEADRCDRLAILDRGKLVACDAPGALKSQIGGDIITLTTRAPEDALVILRERYPEMEIIDGQLRLQHKAGHELVPQLIEAIPGMVEAVTVGKPTLEDVFIRATGHMFRAQDSVV